MKQVTRTSMTPCGLTSNSHWLPISPLGPKSSPDDVRFFSSIPVWSVKKQPVRYLEDYEPLACHANEQPHGVVLSHNEDVRV